MNEEDFDPKFIRRHLRNVDIQFDRRRIVYTMANDYESFKFTINLPANVEARKTDDSRISLMSVTPCKTISSMGRVTTHDYEQFYLEPLLDGKARRRRHDADDTKVNDLRWICKSETDRTPRLALRR